MVDQPPDPPEIEELELAAAWRLRQLDADPSDAASAQAASALQRIADSLRDPGLAHLWLELRALCSWLSESDLISDYAELAAAYRAHIGVSDHPADGAAYLRELLAIANSLV